MMFFHRSVTSDSEMHIKRLDQMEKKKEETYETRFILNERAKNK